MKPYYLYMALLSIFVLFILITPLVMIHDAPAGEALHGAFSLTCHQLAARSYCFYPSDGSAGDCPDVYSRAMVLDSEKGPAYKFPVCARDTAIYLVALVGGIALYFTEYRDSSKPPNPLFFVIALIPIALDGGTQLIGLRESTNFLRALTGAIAGFAFSFYAVPMLNTFLLKKKAVK